MFLGKVTFVKGLFLFLHFIVDIVSVWWPLIHCYRQRGEGGVDKLLVYNPWTRALTFGSLMSSIPGRGPQSSYTCILQLLYTCICLLCRQLHTLPSIMSYVSKQHTFFAKIRKCKNPGFFECQKKFLKFCLFQSLCLAMVVLQSENI